MFKAPNPRTFALVETPNVVDPDGSYPLVEYSASANRKALEGVAVPMHYHQGWRAKLIAFLIRKLLPKPDYIYTYKQV